MELNRDYFETLHNDKDIHAETSLLWLDRHSPFLIVEQYFDCLIKIKKLGRTYGVSYCQIIQVRHQPGISFDCIQQ